MVRGEVVVEYHRLVQELKPEVARGHRILLLLKNSAMFFPFLSQEKLCEKFFSDFKTLADKLAVFVSSL